MLQKLKYLLKNVVSNKYKYLHRYDIKYGDVVIDLGANVGEVSAYFANRGAFVHAYEPNSHAFGVLEKRLGKNKNIKLYNTAVSNHSGTSKLWLHENHKDSEIKFSQGASLQKDKSNVSSDYMEVKVSDISEILEKHSHIKLLKVDIEGGEYDIIDIILENAGKIDHILLETHGEKHASFAEKEKRLQSKIKKSPHCDKFETDWF